MDKLDILKRLDFYREAPAESHSTVAPAARYVSLARREIGVANVGVRRRAG